MEVTEFNVVWCDDGLGESMATGNGVAILGDEEIEFVVITHGDSFTFAVVTDDDNPIMMPVPVVTGVYDNTPTDPDQALLKLVTRIVTTRTNMVHGVFHEGYPWVEQGQEPEEHTVGESRLVYAEEVDPGAVIWWEPSDAKGCDVDPGWAAVLRTKPSTFGPIAMILDRDGEQVPGYYSPVEVVRLRNTVVNLFDNGGPLAP